MKIIPVILDIAIPSKQPTSPPPSELLMSGILVVGLAIIIGLTVYFINRNRTLEGVEVE